MVNLHGYNMIIDHEHVHHVRQLQASCGLATAIMALNPWHEPRAKELLDLVNERVLETLPGLRHFLEKENTRYQFDAAYIILKSAISDKIHECLVEHDPAIYEFFRDVILYDINTKLGIYERKAKNISERPVRDFIERGTISAGLLKLYAGIIKTDIELKLLLAVFGYQFVPYPRCTDGTGSVLFSALLYTKNGHANAEGGIGFLTGHFGRGKALINKGSHWVVVKKMITREGNPIELYYIDPSSVAPVETILGRHEKNARVYMFKHVTSLGEKMRVELQSLLEAI